MFRRTDAATPRHAQHHRAMQAAAGAVAQAGGVADQMVDHRIHEAVELRFGDRLHALRGQPDAQPGDGGLVQWRIQHAVAAEALLQAGGGTKHPAVDADIFAQHQYRRVVFQFPGQGLGDGFDQGDGRTHGDLSARCRSVVRGTGVLRGVRGHMLELIHGATPAPSLRRAVPATRPAGRRRDNRTSLRPAAPAC